MTQSSDGEPDGFAPGWPGAQVPPAGGWRIPQPEPTLQFSPPEPTQPIHPQTPAYQDPYGQGDPYPQQYPYAQQDPSQYGYADYPGAPPPNSSKNALIAVMATVALLGAGASAYWFGFHDRHPQPIGFGTRSAAATTPSNTPTDTTSASDSPSPSATGTLDQVGTLQALLQTMTDPGCRSAIHAVITFDESTASDQNDPTSLINDYGTAITALSAAQSEAQDSTVADAIGTVISDWRKYVSELAGGQNPDSGTLLSDSAALISACLG